jgi:SET and MYND domain-containing protein
LLSAAEVAALLAKEQLNCFGLLAPLHLQQQQAAGAADAAGSDDGGSSSRRLRGGALYPICALLNHECIPNVARFDALDAAVGGAWPAQWTAAGQQQQQAAALVAAVAGSDAAAAAALAAAAGLSAGPHGSSGAGACGCGSSTGGGCGGSSTTQVTMRALHGLPAGTEVVLSYVPLNWDLLERQQQTQRVSL